MKTALFIILVIIAIVIAILAILFIYATIETIYLEKHKYDIIYAKETHRESIDNLSDSEKGEFLMCMAMNQLKEYKRANFNAYFPIKGGKTEIDSILVHKTGIYVFESKYYEGKVVGGWDDEYWYQKIPFKKSREFYNPILQNKGHIKALKVYVAKRGLSECPIYSIVAFADHTKVKQQKRENENTYVCKYSDIKQIILSIEEKMDSKDFLTEDQISRYHWIFDSLTYATQEEKEKHVEYVKVIQKLRA